MKPAALRPVLPAGLQTAKQLCSLVQWETNQMQVRYLMQVFQTKVLSEQNYFSVNRRCIFSLFNFFRRSFHCKQSEGRELGFHQMDSRSTQPAAYSWLSSPDRHYCQTWEQWPGASAQPGGHLHLLFPPTFSKALSWTDQSRRGPHLFSWNVGWGKWGTQGGAAGGWLLRQRKWRGMCWIIHNWLTQSLRTHLKLENWSAKGYFCTCLYLLYLSGQWFQKFTILVTN